VFPLLVKVKAGHGGTRRIAEGKAFKIDEDTGMGKNRKARIQDQRIKKALPG
jgi:hypothetical protein